MQYSQFQCRCPYELNDIIKCKDNVNRTIDDIRTIYELKNKNVYFEYYLKEMAMWVSADFVVDIVK